MELILHSKKYYDNSMNFEDFSYYTYELYETYEGYEIWHTITHKQEGCVTSMPIHKEHGTFTLEYYQRVFKDYQ